MKTKTLMSWVLACLCLSGLYAQPTIVVDTRVHIFATSENEELGISIQQAENMIAKMRADFNGTTYNLSTGNPAADADTHIDFCPEFIFYFDDDLYQMKHSDLDALYGSANKYDMYFNYYGPNSGNVMLKGTKLSSSSSWSGTRHGKVPSPTADMHTFTHETGHSFGLPHNCTGGCVQTCNDCTNFMMDETATNNVIPDHFTLAQGTTMYNNIVNSPYILGNGCTTDYTNAGFTVSEKGPQIGNTIVFTNASHSNATSFTWTFGAGASPLTANGPGPHTVSYTTDGFKDVSLTVTTATDSDTRTQTSFIHVEPTSISLPYHENFNDPQFLTDETWFLEDDNMDGVSFVYKNEMYMRHQFNEIGRYYVNSPKYVPFTNADGEVGSGALTLEMYPCNPSWLGKDLYVNSPDFNFTNVNCGTISFEFSHIPFNNGYTQISPPASGNCDCFGAYLNEPEYAGNSAPNPIGNWADVCATGICPSTSAGLPDCSDLEKLSVEYSIAGASWVSIWSEERDELLTVPGEACTPHMFAPIDADWWRCVSLAIPGALYGMDDVRFRFNYHTGEGSNTLLIDNFRISNGPAMNVDIQPMCAANAGTATATLASCASGGTLSYQWFSDCNYTTPLVGEVNASLTVNSPGDYGLEVYDTSPCTSRTCVTIPQYFTPCTPVSSVTVCEQECVTIGCPSIPGHTYQWSHAESRDIIVKGVQYQYTVTVSDGTDSEICVSPHETTVYTLVIDNGLGCQFSHSITVNVDPSASCVPAGGSSCCDPGTPPVANPCFTFEKNYGTEGTERVGQSNPLHSGAVAQSADYGYLLSGYTDDVQVGAYSDGALAKVDYHGALQWVKQYGDLNGFSDFMDIIPTQDGNYLITGGLGLAGQAYTMHVMKVYPNGNIIWDKVLYGQYFSTSRSIIEAANGDIVVGGYTNYGAESFYVVRLQSDGTLIWRKNYRSTKNSYFSKVIEIQGGTYDKYLVCVGSTLANGIDGYILVLKSDGTYSWSGNYDMGGAEEFFDVIQIDNNDLAVCGYSTRMFGSNDGLVARIPISGGAPSVTSLFSTIRPTHFSSLSMGATDQIVVAGQTLGGFFTPGTHGVFAALDTDVSTTYLGATHWVKLSGVGGMDTRLRDIIKVQPDNGFAIFGENNDDLFLGRVLSSGLSYPTEYPGKSHCYLNNGNLGSFSELVNMTFQDLTTIHTDEITPAIPGFVMYSNQAIAAVATWDQGTRCEFDCTNAKTGETQEEEGIMLTEKPAVSPSVYPNPTQGTLTLALPSGSDQRVSYQVMSIDGKFLIENEVANWQGKTEIDLRPLANGLYLILVQQGNKPYRPLRISKQ